MSSFPIFFIVILSKEMWDTLKIILDGTTETKRSRMNKMISEYEFFYNEARGKYLGHKK